jgi:uncharacterized membrane protein
VVFGIVLYAPVVRRQRAGLERGGPTDPDYVAATRRSTALGILTTVLVVAIVFLMVTKPTL